MRLIVLTPFIPLEGSSHGGGVYLHALLGALARRVEIGLIALCTAAEREEARPERLPPGCAVTPVRRLSRRDPGPWGGLRDKLHTAWGFGVLGLPVAVAKWRSTALVGALRGEIQRCRPDAVLVEMTLMGQYLDACGAVPTVLTDHEAATPVPAGVLPFGIGAGSERRHWQRYLDAILSRADLLQALNEDDAETLRRRCGRAVAVRPPAVPVPPARVEPEHAPRRLLFLGDYSHPPNREAAIHLASEILPRVRRSSPDASLVLAGDHAPATVLALAEIPGVEVAGLVPDLAALLGSGRALVAPLFSGGDSRIKVMTALAHGLPVVANALAARGIDAPPPALTLAESPAQFAERCAGLLTHDDSARAASVAARGWAERNISADHAAAVQLAAIEELLRRRSERPRSGPA